MPSREGEKEDRFDKVAASPNSQNLTERGREENFFLKELMTTPTDPTQSNIPPYTPPGQQPPPGAPPPQTSYLDPSGKWAAFLSTPGNPASAEQVKMFMNTMLQFFNSMVAQQQADMQQANQQLKNVAEGLDPDQ